MLTKGTSAMGVQMRLAAVLLPILLAGCGAVTAQDGRGEGSGGDATGEPSAESAVVHELTCDTEMRSAGTLDFFSSTGGAATAEAAARVLAKPGGDVVVKSQTESHATAYLLRADGTASSELGLVVLDDDTWIVETMESCSGESPLSK